jgi:glycosyltransferase involved in cell wall biosynthesis
MTMQKTSTASTGSDKRFIYIAGPWTHKGGGMFKIADYLIQAQALNASTDVAELRPLDTRGGGHSVFSFWVLATALGKLLKGKMNGKLAGVHVNMAERLSFFRKVAIMAVCRALGVPVVLHLHAAQLHHAYRAWPQPLRALARWAFSLPSSCVVLGSAARRFVHEELKVPGHRIDVVINGVPEPAEARRDAAAQARQRILFVGNLSERKGVSDLLHAMAVPGFDKSRVELVFAGGGDVKSHEDRARELGVHGFVRFAGWSDQRQVARLMAQADVLVLPSYDEGLPLVILEAMAHGVAVVCSPVGEIPFVLTDQVNAFFVQPGDVKAIAAGLQQVLTQPALREQLERNGRALYERQFSLARFSANIAHIHQRHFGIASQPPAPEVHARITEAVL